MDFIYYLQWRSLKAEKVTGSSNDSLQLRLLKTGTLLKERICAQREQIISYKSSPLLLPHKMISLECYYFYYARAKLRNGSYANDIAEAESMMQQP